MRANLNPPASLTVLVLDIRIKIISNVPSVADLFSCYSSVAQFGVAAAVPIHKESAGSLATFSVRHAAKPADMSAQQLELAVLYAYNPPGVGEEAADVKAQVAVNFVPSSSTTTTSRGTTMSSKAQ